MTIAFQADHVNIEFAYVAKNNPQDKIWIKYHHTDMGATISLSNDKEAWFAFPAALFSEATDFLRDKHGLLPSMKGIQTAPAARQATAVATSTSTSVLAPPVIEDATSEDIGEQEPPPIELADVEPVQSLSALAQGNTVDAGDTGIGRSVTRSRPEKDDRNLTDEEIIMRQKQNEAGRVNEGKGIRRA
tara:strand:+ start:381 stop:944 length:564 start_codon:yes stop_codon:yes gene_type:complete